MRHIQLEDFDPPFKSLVVRACRLIYSHITPSFCERLSIPHGNYNHSIGILRSHAMIIESARCLSEHNGRLILKSVSSVVKEPCRHADGTRTRGQLRFCQLNYGMPLERLEGIEPSSPAWKAGALPLSYRRRALKHLERLAGIEPASRPWQGRALPLGYRRIQLLEAGTGVAPVESRL